MSIEKPHLPSFQSERVDHPKNSTFIQYPGQGSQFVGMGEKLYHKFPTAKKKYDAADKILNYKISEISFFDRHNQLNKTEHTQPGIFVHSDVAGEIMEELGKEGFNPPSAFVVGHSLGEYNALVKAGALSFEDGLKLIDIRARGMQEACDKEPGGMNSILGVTEEQVREVMDKIKGLEIAVINEGNSVVVGGSNTVLEKATEEFGKMRRTKVMPLPVDGAFHTSLMQPAQEALARALDNTNIKDTQIPVVANTDTSILYTPADIRYELITQLTTPVRWKNTITFLKENGLTKGVEPGEKGILSNIKKRAIGGTIASIAIGGVALGTAWFLHEHEAEKHKKDQEEDLK